MRYDKGMFLACYAAIVAIGCVTIASLFVMHNPLWLAFPVQIISTAIVLVGYAKCTPKEVQLHG